MKQSILSKCFAKMKRVALALFAAFCVGSVWAEEGEVTYETTPMADPSAGYIRTGLGLYGKEVAVVFTNHTAQATWTVPYNLNNVEFLVVGGGGGGGADTYDEAACGGAGGGGGGVVTGVVDLTKDSVVTVTVGTGGAGGQLVTDQKDGETGTFYGASKKGGNSSLAVAGTTYVTAYGGGRDQGADKRYSYDMAVANMREGGQGGSNGGSRGGITAEQSKNPTMGVVASLEALRNCTVYGNKGGKGCSDYFYGFPSAGGGGGATEAGGDAGNSDAGWPGGKGGEGLASDITGVLLVYGSGGGGASTQGSSGGTGGDGAGNGGDREDAQGTSALANQGGGGGGSSRETTYGGAGGSGIVVLRYVAPIVEEDVRKLIKDYEWTGSEISLLAETDLYTVEGDIAKTDVGEYTVTVTPKEGWNWDDGSNGSKDYTWKIITATNEWTTAPSISKESWKYNDNEHGVLENNPVAKFGIINVTYKKDGEVVDYSTDLFNTVGQYEVIYSIPAGENNSYTELVTTIHYTVEKLDNEWITAPSISATSWIVGGTEKITLTSVEDLETKYPGQVSVMISKNGAEPVAFDGTLPTEAGRYKLTYSVPEGVQDSNIYGDFTYTIDFAINNPVRESLPNSVGYKLLGLGVNNDEVAVVFTKSSDTWKPPVKIDGAQFLVVGGGGGGGADPHYDAASGGAGGGGGGVVTGEVDFAKGTNVAVNVGAGGAGGQLRTSQTDGESGTLWGASKKGGNTTLVVGGKTYVTAYGGGRDRGTDKKDSSDLSTANMREGGQGGSNGGSRGGYTTAQTTTPKMGAFADVAALHNCVAYGNIGGKGCSEKFYGYPSAGGGGGA
ncbi:MAG: hypothetical protein J6Q84_06120, partial [Kiritimatiellae bacterium]|nr:hypothetical protein [Kiritimatiellia bacterium]